MPFKKEIRRELGRHSFIIKRSNKIAELLPFESEAMSKPKFKMKMKECTPLFMND